MSSRRSTTPYERKQSGGQYCSNHIQRHAKSGVASADMHISDATHDSWTPWLSIVGYSKAATSRGAYISVPQHCLQHGGAVDTTVRLLVRSCAAWNAQLPIVGEGRPKQDKVGEPRSHAEAAAPSAEYSTAASAHMLDVIGVLKLELPSEDFPANASNVELVDEIAALCIDQSRSHECMHRFCQAAWVYGTWCWAES